MKPVFLVHGAWHGVWCWQDVCRALARAGCEATAIGLTGLGERAHLQGLPPTATTHVEDIRRTLEYAAPRDAVLVLHSYGGLPGTAAAAALLGQNPSIIGHVIYLDARVPRPGERWCDQHGAEEQVARRSAAQARADCAIPPPDPAALGLTGAQARRARKLMTPQPVALYDAPFDFDPGPLATARRSFVHCIASPRLVPDALVNRLRNDPAWQYLTLDTGHDAMLTQPGAVADIILSAARAV